MDNGYVIYVSDVESTGLDPLLNDIIELSMLRLIPLDKGYQEDQKTWLIKCVHPESISDEALNVNGHKREDILHLTKFGKENYRLPSDVLDEIENWIMEDNVSSVDRVWLGQNPTFDVNFLKEFYKRCGREKDEDFPFLIGNGNRILDLKQIILLFDLCTQRRRKYYNLGSIVKALGVKKEKTHKADSDTRMTKDCILKLISFIKDIVKDKFQDCYSNDE